MKEVNGVLKLLQTALPTLKVVLQKVPNLSEVKGFPHKRQTVEINGVKGFLVWDFIVYNEIYFEDMNGHIFSFFTSISDEETQAKWDELVEKYGK